MPDDHGRESDEHDKARRPEQVSAQPGGGEGVFVPDALPPYPGALLGDPRLNGRGNQPVRVAVMQRMQQTYGNRAVQHFLQRRAGGDRTAIQRDGPDGSTLPPVPDVTLTTPSLLQPSDPAARYRLGGDQHLHLDPKLEAMMRQHVQTEMDLSPVQAATSQLQFTVQPLPQPGQPTPGAGAPTPGPAPTSPGGTDPAKTVPPLNPTDIMRSAVSSGTFKVAWDRLQTQITNQAVIDWSRLKTGEKVAVVSTTVAIGLGAIGGAALTSDPTARQWLVGQLNGRVIPVPKLSWLKVEVNTEGDNLMFGLHADVGSLLGAKFGFKASSPTPMGAPPQPPSMLPGQ